MNVAYQTAQGISNNLSRSFQKGNDERAIEQILSEAKASNDPNMMNDSIGKLIAQVSPERRGDAIQYLQYVNQNLEKKEQQRKIETQEIKRREGLEREGLNPDLPDSLNKIKLEDKNKQKVGKTIKDSLIKAGYPEETSALWEMQFQAAPVGGQSDVIKQVNDLIKRSPTGKGQIGKDEINVIKPSIDIPGITNEPLELDFPDLPEPIGLTPSDTVKQNEFREKTNSPLYNETVDRLNALDDEYREVKHLQDLNDAPGALPTGFQKWNVDWDTGDLRVKALATPETQDYVKTIARMARRAKDFFPGRVTNFDLDQFKQGFPTLANSPEGRKIIAEQLALGNRIAYLKDETFKAAVEHYGSGADPVLIKKYATQNYRRLKGQLEDQLKSVNENARKIVNSSSNTRVDVYDSSGNKVGDIDVGESDQLPEGYSIK